MGRDSSVLLLVIIERSRCGVWVLADGTVERRASIEGTSASEAGTVFGRSATPSPSHEHLPPRRRSSRSVTGLDPVLCSTLQVMRLCCVWQQVHTRLLSHCVQRPCQWTGCLQAECRPPAFQEEPFCGILLPLWSVLPIATEPSMNVLLQMTLCRQTRSRAPHSLKEGPRCTSRRPSRWRLPHHRQQRHLALHIPPRSDTPLP